MRSQRLVLCLMVLILAALACTAPGADNSGSVSPAVTQESTQEALVVTATLPPATSIPPIRPSAMPIPPTSPPPSFSRLITFAETPDISKGQREFQAGVTQIYALWQYSNMTDGLVIRRDWYLDGELWISKVEQWDFAKYGANGSVTDISIHDLQNGLTSGHYELKLYIDTVAQFVDTDDPALRSFDIAPSGDGGS